MHFDEKFNFKKIIVELTGTIVGAFFMAIGTSLFLLPNQLSSGGFAGVPMGTTIMILNVPLFILAIYKLR